MRWLCIVRYAAWILVALLALAACRAAVTAPVEVSLGDGLSVRAYPDTRPHNLKLSAVHKGLVLVDRGEELIAEGFGFGLPIVMYGRMSYLSQEATLRVTSGPDETTIVKGFGIDSLDRTQQGAARFDRVSSLGTVVITYVVAGPRITVTADFGGLRPFDFDQFYVTAEQGSTFFTQYRDSDGRQLSCEDIGPWQAITATTACFSAPAQDVEFCVLSDAGVRKYFGQERVSIVDWAGVDAELPPETLRYTSVITIGRLSGETEP